MTPLQSAELRRTALEVLALRQEHKLDLAGIRRRIVNDKLVDFLFDDPDLLRALTFLISAGFVTPSEDALGSAIYYQATAAGVLHFERA